MAGSQPDFVVTAREILDPVLKKRHLRSEAPGDFRVLNYFAQVLAASVRTTRRSRRDGRFSRRSGEASSGRRV